MIRDLFNSDPFSDLLGPLFGLGSCAQPPDSVPLRILGLDAIPLSRDTLKSVFRAKVMATHPDLATYTVPHLREAAETAATLKPDVQELMWARDVLIAKSPNPLRLKPESRSHG